MADAPCPTCQTPVPAAALYCPNCGSRTGTGDSRLEVAPAPDVQVQLALALGPKYEVRRLLGEGGFAQVYEVFDTDLQRALAIKVLKPDIAWSAGMLDRFRQECRSIARLSHPNIAFFLLLVFGIFTNHTTVRFYGTLGLSLFSLRGIILIGFFLVMDIILHKTELKITTRAQINKFINSYSPFLFLGVGFIIVHYYLKGWVGTHAGSPWAPSFAKVGWLGVAKNLLIFGWRLFDLGHIFILAPAFIIIYRLTGQDFLNKKQRQIVLILVFTLIFLIPQVVFSGLMAYRYFLPIYLSGTLITFYGLYYFLRHLIYATITAVLLILGLFTGHFWVYPRYMARGWDRSLAYLPYSELIDKAKGYLNKMEIPYSSVGTAFPNLRSEYFTHLNNNRRIFKEKDLEQDVFILYSNVMNDFTEAEIKTLFAEWNVVQGWKKGAVEVILFKK